MEAAKIVEQDPFRLKPNEFLNDIANAVSHETEDNNVLVT